MDRGSTSVLRFFRFLVQIAWIGLILACVYLALGVPSGALDARMVRPWLGVGVWDAGLALGLPWESLAPSQWSSFCLTVGVWNLAGLVAVLVAVDQVRRILSGPIDRSPFTLANANRIRVAGVAILCAAGAKAFRDVAFTRFVVNNVHIAGIQVGYATDLGLSTTFLGLMILAFAEVMRHGAKLQEEQDLVV